MPRSDTSILLFFFGQSNADVFLSRPPISHPLERDTRILTPNDGWGIRGSMGRPQTRPITGFETAFDHSENSQSMGIAAAARLLHELRDEPAPHVIVRSGAKGGRRLDGFAHSKQNHYGLITDHLGQPSILLKSFLNTGRQIVEAARNEGIPVSEVFIPFFHGEGDVSLPRAAYADRLRHLIDTVDTCFAEMDLKTTWLLTQPGGTSNEGNGNHWPNRLSLWDVADALENVHLVSANYAYPMEDHSHIGPVGRALIGEQLGRAIAGLMRGVAPNLPRPRAWSVFDGVAKINFGKDAELALDRTQFPRPRGTDGFSLSTGPDEQVIDATIDDDGDVSLKLSREVRNRPFVLNYAYRRLPKPERTPTDGYPFGRGCLRCGSGVPSLLLPERYLFDWVPAFSLPFKPGS